MNASTDVDAGRAARASPSSAAAHLRAVAVRDPGHAGEPAAARGCPGPPQLPQLPAAQVIPMFGHVEPAPVHTFMTQQPPEPHVVFSQHGWPGAPHAVQTPPPPPPPVQTSLASQARPAQQACPGPPHAWQMPPTHEPPVAHGVFPAQQTVPSEPRAPTAPHVSMPKTPISSQQDPPRVGEVHAPFESVGPMPANVPPP